MDIRTDRHRPHAAVPCLEQCRCRTHRTTIQNEVNTEAKTLRNMDRAREGVKNWLEGPNTEIDRIIRSVSQGGAWKVSNKLASEFPALAEAEVAENVVNAVREAFDSGESEQDRLRP
jgi:hypothetical protein